MLGICIVYLVTDPGSAPLLRLSLEQFRRFTDGPYRIYGTVLRSPRKVSRLLRREGVRLFDYPDGSEHAALEHAGLLDRLVDEACNDGCDAVATFDLDSWPVMRGWDGFYRGYLGEATPLVSIVRTELTDNFPFPGFTLFPASFWSPG